MKILCRIFGHDWSMYAGYDEVRVHPTAICVRRGCGVAYKDLK